MQWTHFFCNIVKHYSVVIKRWQEQIPFINLSTASSSLTHLKMLLRKWCSGLVSWKCITPEQLQPWRKIGTRTLKTALLWRSAGMFALTGARRDAVILTTMLSIVRRCTRVLKLFQVIVRKMPPMTCHLSPSTTAICVRLYSSPMPLCLSPLTTAYI